jgi:hypothetical protein
MLQNILFVLVVATNLVVFHLGFATQKVFWSLYGFLIWSMTIIGLSISGWGLLALAVAVLWIHGLLKYRPVLKKVIAEPYMGSGEASLSESIPPRPKIDPNNIQGSFYGLNGYTNNPYERL